MPERPLILFPTYEKAERTKLTPGIGRIHLPDYSRQTQRLPPIFTQLQNAFNNRRIELLQSTTGIDPEQVLVIETIGSVENFVNAVKRIHGLEWLAEIEIDEIEPDQDFFEESKPNKQLSGHLYLLMTNQQALNEMLSLWQRYQADQKMKFDRGFTKFRDVFLHLKEIRRWDVQDRLMETGIIGAWKEDLKNDSNRSIRFETELWFRNSQEKQQASQKQVVQHILSLGGRILGQTVITEIAYHALLAELPANSIRKIINNPSIELVKCDSIMFFRPAGQMSAIESPKEGNFERVEFEEKPDLNAEPIIAILDGVPLSNHSLLQGRLIIDDPDDWTSDYNSSEMVHGTSMASLVIHGDLNDVTTPLERPVYMRPIMKPVANAFHVPRPESVPDDILVVDLIHRAVKRIFEGESGTNAVSPKIKIINLSLGDRSRQLTNFMSPLARLLDWLSDRYNVLFIISAGNHAEAISLPVKKNEFETLNKSDLEELIVRALFQDNRNRRLLSPSESINGITVGAAHYDNSEVKNLGNRFDPYKKLLPSPISAFGSGYRKSVKPDIIYYGGRQFYQLPLLNSEQVKIEPALFRVAPGNKTALPGKIPGDVTTTAYSCGTSNATALISRAAGIYHDSLLEIFKNQSPEENFEPFFAPLIKAMLVHGCAWNDLGQYLSEIIKTSENGRQINNWIRRWIGYGLPQIDRVLECTGQRATLLGFGKLSEGEAHLFHVPYPPSLGSKAEWRRLTITLAWLSPVSANTQKYRTACLWFELNNKTLTPKRSGVDWQTVRRGTVQHEVFEGEKAEPFMDGNNIEIKVNCREDAAKIQTPITYGLVVSLEVKEGLDIAIYDEIRTLIIPSIRIRQSTQSS